MEGNFQINYSNYIKITKILKCILVVTFKKKMNNIFKKIHFHFLFYLHINRHIHTEFA